MENKILIDLNDFVNKTPYELKTHIINILKTIDYDTTIKDRPERLETFTISNLDLISNYYNNRIIKDIRINPNPEL